MPGQMCAAFGVGGAYVTGKLLAWLLGKNITPHIPVWERDSSADGMFSRSEFTYDAARPGPFWVS
jgi:hypothetical protein